ncbi:lipoxygenase [Selaginella moellendorffii]|uniref:Lipoxygenase n=1 Tax=Selaginella moellendorffii TaxID=88036 RepID=D8QMU6_SELML|nr:linoleate 9S-lipoxygenase [Selaginella moellendorffii]XP_024530687.1 linoleate 9S-lipoxygenase [Selaginella moellendorffii]EFJ38647.1 lipoxygenase [Selaginella moellendorffii]|eukprot:XP_002961108.1 linoleate 9S-lipoxygenase [Selaginella moellendorffii]
MAAAFQMSAVVYGGRRFSPRMAPAAKSVMTRSQLSYFSGVGHRRSSPVTQDGHFVKLFAEAFKVLSSASTVELLGYATFQKQEQEGIQAITLQLISTKADSATRLEVLSDIATVDWHLHDSSPSASDIKCPVKFLIRKDFGEPGAILVNSGYGTPMLLKSLVLEMPNKTTIGFLCDTWISNGQQRVFFANKAYLPLDTPSGLMKLRTRELASIRGNGSGVRVNGERIYDYDVYNDLGNPDYSPDLLRPVLGGSSTYPYPRRCRTGRMPSNTDNTFESSASSEKELYLPAGEAPAFATQCGAADNAVQSLYQLIPEIHKAYASRPFFDNVGELRSLFTEGFNLKPEESRTTDNNCCLKFPLPQVLGAHPDAWMLDSEFARQTIAGLNPITIECLKVFPPHRLDPSETSSLNAAHIESQLGSLSVSEALEASRLFVLDYHDAFMPYLEKINAQEGVRSYASRTIFFLTDAGTLTPVAIELSLPSPGEAINRVFVPGETSGERDWLWELAKVHASTNDAAYHQAISHWLRTHAVLEPFIIATHRQLSDLHPVKGLLLPHLKSTISINSEARRLLICAGGIIERAFFTGKYTLEISSLFYKSSWRFDEQGLPADLLKRGMAVRDPTAKHGLKLRIEDYPYAVDGLEIWSSIQTWVDDYVNIFYMYDVSVCADTELQNWWREITEVGHADKKEGWQDLSTKSALKEVLTTVIWLASAHHAAVNFGQFAYAGFTPNRPTITHRFIPEAGSEEHQELLQDPEKFFCSTLANRLETITLLCAIELLSSHLPGQEFLGEQPSSKWTSDQRVMAAFESFSQRLEAAEDDIELRNEEPSLENRRGPAEVPFTLLCPSSGLGLTGRGVPNSVSI